MSLTNDEMHRNPAELSSMNAEGIKIPTFSFTSAVTNFDHNRFNQTAAENFSEPTENLSITAVDHATEYDILREYMDDQWGELCYMQIEQTLEQLCDRANEPFVEIEDDLWDHSSENTICANYNGVNYNDILYNNPGYNDLEYIYPAYNDDIYSSPMQHVTYHIANMNHNNNQTTPFSQMAESHLEGSGATQQCDKFVGKRCLCRHFLKGRCNRGNSCDFLHDESIFCSDEQKVFLGGLSRNITDETLRKALKMQGYTVLNKPKVLEGFSPQICLGSVQEAQQMVRRGKIIIEGTFVDVRPYEEIRKDSLNMGSKNDVKRSVFLGGLPSNTTG